MYEVVRFSQGNNGQRVIRTGMTLQEAQRLCQDPETSSNFNKELFLAACFKEVN